MAFKRHSEERAEKALAGERVTHNIPSDDRQRGLRTKHEKYEKGWRPVTVLQTRNAKQPLRWRPVTVLQETTVPASRKPVIGCHRKENEALRTLQNRHRTPFARPFRAISLQKRHRMPSEGSCRPPIPQTRRKPPIGRPFHASNPQACHRPLFTSPSLPLPLKKHRTLPFGKALPASLHRTSMSTIWERAKPLVRRNGSSPYHAESEGRRSIPECNGRCNQDSSSASGQSRDGKRQQRSLSSAMTAPSSTTATVTAATATAAAAATATASRQRQLMARVPAAQR